MAGTESIDARLLTGKCVEVRMGSDDDVLAIGGARDLMFLLAVETLVAYYLRETYRPACDPVPRELRRVAGGLVVVGASAGFRLRRREELAYFEVAPEVVRDVLERANRDPGEIARWSSPPQSGAKPKPRPRKRTAKSAAIVAVVQRLAMSGPWGWTAPEAAKCAHCSVGFFYRFLRENEDIRRLWRYYQVEGRGKGPGAIGRWQGAADHPSPLPALDSGAPHVPARQTRDRTAGPAQGRAA